VSEASVELWGRRIGAVVWQPERGLAAFQYTPEFSASGIEPAPMMMPLREAPYEFPELSRQSFLGLPGLLADALPDKFGTALIDAWLAEQNRTAKSFNPVERLCYVGTRGMGALEFQPVQKAASTAGRPISIDRLVALANRIVNERSGLAGVLKGQDDQRAIEDILRVGTSAGGARAKAVLAWNERTGEFRSGQLPMDQGFEAWLMKFDGVGSNHDKELADPMGYGRIEYACYLMAIEAGIRMMPSRLHFESGRAHFMTRRFDRTERGGKRHYQSLAALMHFDFNQAGAYGYEQALGVIQHLGLPNEDMEQQIRRTFFNVLIRNQDDHVKNIGFLMNKQGLWRLSPAFDVVYSYNPDGAWTSRHQMSLQGKRDGYERDDLIEFARVGGMKAVRAKRILNDVAEAVARWPQCAEQAGIDGSQISQVRNGLRLTDLGFASRH